MATNLSIGQTSIVLRQGNSLQPKPIHICDVLCNFSLYFQIYSHMYDFCMVLELWLEKSIIKLQMQKIGIDRSVIFHLLQFHMQLTQELILKLQLSIHNIGHIVQSFLFTRLLYIYFIIEIWNIGQSNSFLVPETENRGAKSAKLANRHQFQHKMRRAETPDCRSGFEPFSGKFGIFGPLWNNRPIRQTIKKIYVPNWWLSIETCRYFETTPENLAEYFGSLRRKIAFRLPWKMITIINRYCTWNLKQFSNIKFRIFKS